MPSSIPMDQIGTVAGKQYSGDGLAVVPLPDGVRLRCVFQRLDAQVRSGGLWMVSSADGAKGVPFRIKATTVSRTSGAEVSAPTQIRGKAGLPEVGSVTLAGERVRFTRPGLTEEYSVSMDGVRQDFVIATPPPGDGKLCLTLAVDGAVAQQTPHGVHLLLSDDRRKIAYHRLRVLDAAGKALPAALRVDAENQVAVEVQDSNAVYPVLIDPTFSDANWISMGGVPGANGQVTATAADGFGKLFIGGAFTAVGGVFATNIAQWDGSQWSALGLGVRGGIQALAVLGTDLYVGGNFTDAGGSGAKYIARWNGSGWTTVGAGLNGGVAALAVSGGELYVGGGFTAAGGSGAKSIAKWNGTAWSALGSGMNSQVYALAVSGTDLYAGGSFTFAGDNAAKRIARWDGTQWSALGSGMDNTVFALTASGSDLYAGGYFTKAGEKVVNQVAKWNGAEWSGLGSGMNSTVLALAISGGSVYAGGSFTEAGGISASRIAKWDGTQWSALGSGMNSQVAALAVSGNDLFVGGDFTIANGIGANKIAKWSGDGWSVLQPGSTRIGPNDQLAALAVSGNRLFAGGVFTTAGGSVANYIAQWNGTTWSPVGSGLNGYVTALAVSGSNLYAGGQFTKAGGVAANSIAKWNGSNWEALGTGMNQYGYVYALAVSGSDLYAGGSFTMAGGQEANRIAKWDGSRWSPLGSGMTKPFGRDSSVRALAVSGSTLYAGGDFWFAGGLTGNSIAKWDGTAWSALGSGVNQYGCVYALDVSGSDLYAGGFFTTAGGIVANNIAKWDGSSWSALGAGMVRNDFNTPGVSALAVSGSDLYAGGYFTTAGGVDASNIARWDGRQWSALGSGTDYPITAMVVSGDSLYAGGAFTTAGKTFSPYLARALLPGDPPLIDLQPHAVLSPIGSDSSFSVTAKGTAPLFYQWRRDDANLVAGGTISGVNTANLTLANIQTNDAGKYTVVITNAFGSITSAVATLTVIPRLPPGVLPGLYVTNASLLPNGVAQFEVRTPTTNTYTLLYSFDLKTWNFWTVLSGANWYTQQSPGPIDSLSSVFVQLVPLGQVRHALTFRFRSSWHGPLIDNVPALTWPQRLENWQAALQVDNITNLPSSANVFFNGPADSGIAHQPASSFSEDAYARNYESDLIDMPPAPPGGMWTLEYGADNLSFDRPDPQAAQRAITVLPRFGITNGLLHAVSWTYRNSITGAPLSVPPNFIARLSFGLYGPDFAMCGPDDQEIFFRDVASPGITNIVVSPPLVWSNLLAQIEYVDTLDNTYTLNYAFGTYYEVFGATSFTFLDSCDPATGGFTRLGGATSTATFNGAYNYYLVRVPKHNVVKLDTVRSSTGGDFSTFHTSNTSDPGRIGGAPDALFATIGRTPRGFFSGGFVLINASGQGLKGITVHVVP